MRLVLTCWLTLWAASAAAQSQPAWSLGSATASLVQAGYLPAGRAQAWEAELELRFYNGDLRRRFNRNVTVQFQGGDGKGSTWKAFLSLPPGTAQHRRVRVPQRLRCQGALEACPPLRVRVFVDKGSAATLVPVPRQALQEPEAPPAGKPLWVAKVHDGDTLELLDGRKIRLLGVDAPERERRDGKAGSEPGYREAADFCRERVMSAPVTLAYDGEKRDIYGRWLAQVTLADGRDLNAELLRLGLAKVYQSSEAERLERYKKIEAQARAKGLGLWKAP